MSEYEMQVMRGDSIITFPFTDIKSAELMLSYYIRTYSLELYGGSYGLFLDHCGDCVGLFKKELYGEVKLPLEVQSISEPKRHKYLSTHRDVTYVHSNSGKVSYNVIHSHMIDMEHHPIKVGDIMPNILIASFIKNRHDYFTFLYRYPELSDCIQWSNSVENIYYNGYSY